MQSVSAEIVRDPILEEKLQRRAKNLAACLKAFVIAYQEAQQQNKQKSSSGNSKSPGNKAGSSTKSSKAATKPGDASKGGKSSKGKTSKDPKAEAWATVLFDLDERINKSKKCGLEDLYRAVACLECIERQALANIIATTTAKQLPDKQSEAALAIKSTLFAAAAAHSYKEQQVPEASQHNAAVFRQKGLPADSALQAGFRVGQLLRAGYSTAELVQSTAADLQHLRAGGVSVKEVYAALPPDKSAALTGVAGAQQLKNAGFTPQAIQAGAPDGAVTLWDLKLAGYLPSGSTTGAASGSTGCKSARSPVRARSRSRTGSMIGSAIAPCVQTDHVHDAASGTPFATANTESNTGSEQCSVQQREQQRAAEVLHADGPGDVEYFRHQIIPLMHMQPSIDLPELLIGTKDKLVLAGKVDAIEDAPAPIMLAANPVKLAQQRKRSGSGFVVAATAAVNVQAISPRSGAGPAAASSAPRAKQGDKPAISRLRTVSATGDE